MDPDANVEIVTAERMPDPLTGPSDRRLLVERLTQSIERARQYPGFHFAVLCVDLVRPGPSAAGADAVDPVLAAAGRRLEASVRLREKPPTLRHNDVVATLGGDRFAILLDGLKDVGDATVVADRILAEMAAPFPSCGDARLTASVGVAVSATGYAHADALRPPDDRRGRGVPDRRRRDRQAADSRQRAVAPHYRGGHAGGRR